ncbi:hypothetical protein [Actinoallomurus sp. CA-142502]|uniref:hypothetical protein n=1 Tax=Actinoallomurus sp. CA-142502 TaxID=3239885 RepID=UPI003D92DC8D
MTDTPYAADACPGPCNRRYRKTVDAYLAAQVVHGQALADYEEARPVLEAAFKVAMAAYEEAYGWWKHHADAGVLVVREPISPTFPPPPAPPAEPTEDDLAYRKGDPVWCSRDAGLIRGALTALDDLASLLGSWADGHRGSTASQKYGTTGNRANPGSPSPIGDTLDDLYSQLVKCEDDWREYRGYRRRPQRARDSRARRLTLAFLIDELRDILNHPGSVQFGRAVLWWERTLQEMTKTDPVIQRRPARCPNDRCRQRALWTRADGMIECRACGRLMHEHEYQELVDADDGGTDIQEASRP